MAGGGRQFIKSLNRALPAVAASKGKTEEPVVYNPRVSLSVDGIDMRNRCVLYDGFNNRPQRNGAAAINFPNQNFEVLGVNGDTSAVAFAENGVLLTTAGASGDEAILSPIAESQWATSMPSGLLPLVRFRVKLGPVTSVRYEVGVRTTTTAMDDGTDDDKMIVRFDTAGPVSTVNWVLVTSKGGVDTLEDTGIVALSSGNYNFTLAFDEAHNVFLYASTDSVDDELVCDPTLHNMVAPGTNIGVPYGGSHARAAGAKAMRFSGAVRSLAFHA